MCMEAAWNMCSSTIKTIWNLCLMWHYCTWPSSLLWTAATWLALSGGGVGWGGHRRATNCTETVVMPNKAHPTAWVCWHFFLFSSVQGSLSVCKATSTGTRSEALSAFLKAECLQRRMRGECPCDSWGMHLCVLNFSVLPLYIHNVCTMTSRPVLIPAGVLVSLLRKAIVCMYRTPKHYFHMIFLKK